MSGHCSVCGEAVGPEFFRCTCPKPQPVDHGPEQPYLLITVKGYNPDYGDHRVCRCGNYYKRHFKDGIAYPNQGCTEFKEVNQAVEDEIDKLEKRIEELRKQL